MRKEARAMNVRPHQRGYNLVEVLVAMALLAVVMISIMSLFVLARRNIYSGKQMTKANSVATRVLEDLSYMTAAEVLENFALTDTTTLSTPCVTIGGTTYNACTVLATNVGTPVGYLGRWKTMIDGADVKGGVVRLVVTPTNATDTTKLFTTAAFVRLRVIVSWSEAGRSRSVTADATKPKRF